MMMLMKKLFFLFMMLAMGLYAQAQQLDVCTKPFGEEGNEITVIKPTVANFMMLLSMNEDQFKAVMEANKYGNQMPRGNFVTYWNGSPDNFQFAKCVNSFLYNKETKEVHFMVSNDMIYPQGSIMQLYRDLRPYQVRDEAQGPRGPMGGPRANAPQGNMPQGNVPNVPQGNVPQANVPNMPQNGGQATPQGPGRPGTPAQGFGRNRRGGRGGIFGRNGLGFSFVTGYGTYHSNNPHHRYWSYELDHSFPMAPSGVMSGGCGAGLQDPYVGGLGYQRGKVASQKCFVDSIEAWSVNEVTINWNAPFAWAMSFFDDEAPGFPNGPVETTTSTTTKVTTTTTTATTPVKDPVWGDTNCDGTVELADAILIMQYLANPNKYNITEQGKLNGDVDKTVNGLTSNDALRIQEYLLHLRSTLNPNA